MDLVERLRERAYYHAGYQLTNSVLNEAADEIERLREKLIKIGVYTDDQHDGTAPWTSAILDILEDK